MVVVIMACHWPTLAWEVLLWETGALRSSIQDVGLSGGKWGGSTNIANIESEWVRFEVYLVQSTPSVADGKFKVWVHRPYA